jgi:hypothetical protein
MKIKSVLFATLPLAFLACASDVGSSQSDGSVVDVGIREASTSGPARGLTVHFESESEIAVRRSHAEARIPAWHKAHVRGALAPSKFIEGSGQTVVYDTRQVATSLVLRPIHKANGVSAAAFNISVESSDESIARATVDASGNVQLAPTGKLGNAYVTSFDKEGKPTNKFMFLAVNPRENTKLVQKDEGVFGLYDGKLTMVTDFAGQSDVHDAAASMDDLVAHGGFVALSEATAQKLAAFGIGAAPSSPKAVYLSDLDTLLVFESAPYILRWKGRTLLAFSRYGVQRDFANFVDYGGTLNGSRLSDGSQQGAAVDLRADQVSTTPIEVGRLDTAGRVVRPSDAGYHGLLGPEATRVVKYTVNVPETAGLSEEHKPGIVCSLKGNGKLAFRGMQTSASIGFEGSASYENGSPNFALMMHPNANAGGAQVEISGGIDGECHYEIAKIPVYEWTLPLVGKAGLAAPIQVGMRLHFGGKGTVQLPLASVESKLQAGRPGSIGFKYSKEGGFSSELDATFRLNSDHIEPVDDGDEEEGNLDIVATAGLSTGLELEAEIKNWWFKASVNADIANLLFGARYTVSQVRHPAAQVVDQTQKLDIGVFPEVAPTLSINTPFFTASLNLFELDIKPLILFTASDTTHREMIAARNQAVVTCNDLDQSKYGITLENGVMKVTGRQRERESGANVSFETSGQTIWASGSTAAFTANVLGQNPRSIKSGTPVSMLIMASDCPYNMGAQCECSGAFE